jgi:hypothetical protein
MKQKQIVEMGTLIFFDQFSVKHKNAIFIWHDFIEKYEQNLMSIMTSQNN